MQVIYKILTRPGKGEETRAYCISVADWSMLSRSTIGSADDGRDTTTQTVLQLNKPRRDFSQHFTKRL